MKPDGCRCEGEEHKNPHCFVTPAPSPTIGDLLRELGLPHGDEGIRTALLELRARRGRVVEIAPGVYGDTKSFSIFAPPTDPAAEARIEALLAEKEGAGKP